MCRPNKQHSLVTWCSILFRLHSSQQCVCLCVMWFFRHSPMLPAKIFVISRVPCWTTVWTYSHSSLAVFGSTIRHTLLKCLPRVLITISFHVVLWKRVLPIVIFHFSPAWIQVWSLAMCLCCSGWCLTPDIDTTSKQRAVAPLASPQQVNH